MGSKQILLGFSLVVSLLSCSNASSSKKDNKSKNPTLTSLKGKIIYEYTNDVKEIDVSTGTERTYFAYNTYSTRGWDVSRDGTLRLVSERPTGTIDETRFKLVNTTDGSIVKEFIYVPAEGTNQNYEGELSFDNSLILLQPDFDNGIVIMDINGVVKHRMNAINNKKLKLGDYVCWLPGNSILVSFDEKLILKSDPPYTNLTPIKEMNYDDWGSVRASHDGKKISLRIGNHIYLMNSDGSGLTQITESNKLENFAEFSPDGRHLLIGTEYIHAPVSGRSNWRLRVIPADGKKYNIDNSPEVIPVIPNGENYAVRAGGNTFWRP